MLTAYWKNLPREYQLKAKRLARTYNVEVDVVLRNLVHYLTHGPDGGSGRNPGNVVLIKDIEGVIDKVLGAVLRRTRGGRDE